MEIRLQSQAPAILVGTKSDLEIVNDEISIEVRRNRLKALKMKDMIEAVEYVECSAKTSEGVSKVFESAVRAAVYEEGTCGSTKPEACAMM